VRRRFFSLKGCECPDLFFDLFPTKGEESLVERIHELIKQEPEVNQENLKLGSYQLDDIVAAFNSAPMEYIK